MVSFFLPLGVETAVGSYQAISYGFLSLFFFPVVFGASIYSLSKYDEYYANKFKINAIEDNKLMTPSSHIKKEEIKNRAIPNPIKNFVRDTLSVIKRDVNHSEKVVNTKNLFKFGAISLLLAGGTSIVLIDVVKNASSTISPVQSELVIDLENTKISLDKNIQDYKVNKIAYISSSLVNNSNLSIYSSYNPYRIINSKNAEEGYSRIILS